MRSYRLLFGLVFCLVFCRSLFALFFFWPLYCLFFFYWFTSSGYGYLLVLYYLSFDLHLLVTLLLYIVCPSIYVFWLSFWYYIVCPSIYVFWLPFWYYIVSPSIYVFWLPVWYYIVCPSISGFCLLPFGIFKRFLRCCVIPYPTYI